jgi:hypothetical protein
VNVEITWAPAPTRRVAFFADAAGDRLFVQQSVRSVRAHGLIGEEFQSFVNGVRVGDFLSADAAKAGALAAANKKGPAGDAGPVGVSFDY